MHYIFVENMSKKERKGKKNAYFFTHNFALFNLQLTKEQKTEG